MEYDDVNEIDCIPNDKGTFDCKLYSISESRERNLIIELEDIKTVETETIKGVAHINKDIFIGFYSYDNIKCSLFDTMGNKMLMCKKYKEGDASMKDA